MSRFIRNGTKEFSSETAKIDVIRLIITGARAWQQWRLCVRASLAAVLPVSNSSSACNPRALATVFGSLNSYQI